MNSKKKKKKGSIWTSSKLQISPLWETPLKNKTKQNKQTKKQAYLAGSIGGAYDS